MSSQASSIFLLLLFCCYIHLLRVNLGPKPINTSVGVQLLSGNGSGITQVGSVVYVAVLLAVGLKLKSDFRQDILLIQLIGTLGIDAHI